MTNTNKIAALAFTAIVGLGAIATPVLAGGVSDKFDTDFYLQQLRYDGVNAVSVQDAGGDILQARVVTDGHTSYEFFNKNTFLQIK